ncbi:MAG: hypothetical protein JO264_00520 [Acidisphaera sp.]|nr:hypothetical protein [Acidisphaera sp.]
MTDAPYGLPSALADALIAQVEAAPDRKAMEALMEHIYWRDVMWNLGMYDRKFFQCVLDAVSRKLETWGNGAGGR